MDDRGWRMAILDSPSAILDGLGPFPPRFPAAGLDPHDLRLERLAEQRVDQPVDRQRARARVADRVALAFEDVEQLRRRDLAHQLVDEFHIAMLVVLAGDDHVRAGDLRRHAAQAEGFAKLVEGRLVVVAGHVHVIELEGRRRHVEDRVLPRPHAHAAHGAGFETLFRGDHARRPVRAHARAHDAESIGVDLRPSGQIFASELAGVGVIFRGALDAALARLALAGAVDGEHGEAALEKWIAAGGIVFFDAVHAGNVQDARNFLAGFAPRRQMQDGLNLFAVVGQLDPLDGPAGIFDKLVIAGAFALRPAHALGVAVFVDRPHGVGVKAGGDVVVFARFGAAAGRLGLAPLFFAARRGAAELARNIDELLNARADFLEIAGHARAAVAENFAAPALVPVDAAGLNHLVEKPALLAPAAHFAFGFKPHGHRKFSVEFWFGDLPFSIPVFSRSARADKPVIDEFFGHRSVSVAARFR